MRKSGNVDAIKTSVSFLNASRVFGGDATNLINADDRVCAATAANSTATTADGKVVVQDLTGATAVLAAQIQNAIGTALTARTTGNTNTATRIDVNIL